MKFTLCLPNYFSFGHRTKIKFVNCPRMGIWGSNEVRREGLCRLPGGLTDTLWGQSVPPLLSDLMSFWSQAKHKPGSISALSSTCLSPAWCLQTSKCHNISCHSCCHLSWQLFPCKYNWQTKVSLPIPSFPKFKPKTFRSTEGFFHHHYYPSEFPLHRLGKLNGFDASSLSSH